MALFQRKPKYTVLRVAKKKDIPGDLWIKCGDCGELIYKKRLEENLMVCPKCRFHFTVGAHARIAMILDEGTFKEHDENMESVDSLHFEGPKKYNDKLKADIAKTGLKSAAVTGEGKLNRRPVMLAVTDSRFIMGSMGSVVGEKLTKIIEAATEKKRAVIIISGSGGGARMYEGMYSLMQMAKTSAALKRHHESKLPFISVLTDSTMGGAMASFASLGDIIIAEPKALLGFAGPRVIEQTIKQSLPPGFQKSEFLLEHGLIDMIVDRKSLRETLIHILDYLC